MRGIGSSITWFGKLYVLIFVSAFCAGCSPGADYPEEVEQVLERLDETIRKKRIYENGKEQHLARIKSKITVGCTPVQIYAVYDDLYGEYYQYNLDSVMHYARTKLELVRAERLTGQECDALMDLADCYVLAGMYLEAEQLAATIDFERLTYTEIPRYYHIYHALYEGLATLSNDSRLKREYTLRKDEYRQRLYEKLGDDDISKLFVEYGILYDKGVPEEAFRKLRERYEHPEISAHERAVISYLLAGRYQETGEREQAILHYAESAIDDLETPVHEYRSLYELAALLYETGDIERAYAYITCSVNDAMTANARINIHYINQLLPIITRSHEEQMQRKHEQQRRMLWGISLLSLMFVAVTAVAFVEKRRMAEAELRTQKMNDELSQVNTRLQKYIRLLQESNDIKESYLGRYLDLCSDYIGRMERYRARLSKLAKNGSTAELQQALKSTAFIESELDEFYAQFDATFLHLFPNFVEQFNALLQPDKRIETRPGGNAILTTELRVFALIRLGIGDSVKIAEFLRRSVSTIYNYRVKMRNAAMERREEFEKRVMHIGRLS